MSNHSRSSAGKGNGKRNRNSDSAGAIKQKQRRDDLADVEKRTYALLIGKNTTGTTDYCFDYQFAAKLCKPVRIASHNLIVGKSIDQVSETYTQGIIHARLVESAVETLLQHVKQMESIIANFNAQQEAFQDDQRSLKEDQALIRLEKKVFYEEKEAFHQEKKQLREANAAWENFFSESAQEPNQIAFPNSSNPLEYQTQRQNFAAVPQYTFTNLSQTNIQTHAQVNHDNLHQDNQIHRPAMPISSLRLSQDSFCTSQEIQDVSLEASGEPLGKNTLGAQNVINEHLQNDDQQLPMMPLENLEPQNGDLTHNSNFRHQIEQTGENFNNPGSQHPPENEQDIEHADSMDTQILSVLNQLEHDGTFAVQII